MAKKRKSRILLEAITISADNDLSLRFVVRAHSIEAEAEGSIIDGPE